MKSRLGNLRLYKFDVPSESDVGVMIISYGSVHLSERFQLTRCTRRGRGRGSKAGLSKSFVDSLNWSFSAQHESNITKQIFDYIVSNFSFKDLDMVPPADEDARARLVPIVAPTTEIVDCYQSPELCHLCEKGYPKEDEIVHKTKCNHIFHATCISRYLLHTPRCPVCSLELPPVDMRSLLFF
ncbi:PREDICTED: E3 ubiquitin-protein ligase RNF181-like [Camelina sativa]|uniref:E3 ubiquitin-protein ligase RNF181-like n=1 Tax=Camelina sativa TaxID=90675 RepID=A0ABM0WPV4_CAMSA|nr:PREDICTED: E3 ubiquitin-protein ligase RNF181-like [Camelina sativa]